MAKKIAGPEGDKRQLIEIRKLEKEVRRAAATMADKHEDYKSAKQRHQDFLEALLEAAGEEEMELLE
jgi:hypothetical protein